MSKSTFIVTNIASDSRSPITDDSTASGSKAAIEKTKSRLENQVNGFNSQTIIDADSLLDQYEKQIENTLHEASVDIHESISSVDEAIERTLKEATRQNVPDSWLRTWSLKSGTYLFLLVVWLVSFEILAVTTVLKYVDESRSDQAIVIDSAVILFLSIATGVFLWAALRYAARPGGHSLSAAERKSKTYGMLGMLLLFVVVLGQLYYANDTHFGDASASGSSSVFVWSLLSLAILGVQLIAMLSMAGKLYLVFCPVPGLMSDWTSTVTDNRAAVRKVIKRSRIQLNNSSNKVVQNFEQALDRRDVWARISKAMLKTVASINTRAGLEQQGSGRPIDATKLSELYADLANQQVTSVPTTAIDHLLAYAENQLERDEAKFDRAASQSALTPEVGLERGVRYD